MFFLFVLSLPFFLFVFAMLFVVMVVALARWSTFVPVCTLAAFAVSDGGRVAV